MRIEKKFLWISILILGTFIAAPIGFYLWTFAGNELSSNPSNWGVLGDYFGGILNPIISLASLIVLGYLTYLVNEQSSRKNTNLFIYQKKMDAYEELTKPFREINLVDIRIKLALQFTNQLNDLNPDARLQKAIEMKEKFAHVTNIFTEYFHTLRAFDLTYGHLFKYDFSCSDFVELASEIKKIGDYHNEIGIGLFDNEQEIELTVEKFKPNKTTKELMVKVFNEIRREVLPQNN